MTNLPQASRVRGVAPPLPMEGAGALGRPGGARMMNLPQASRVRGVASPLPKEGAGALGRPGGAHRVGRQPASRCFLRSLPATLARLSGER